MNTDFQRTDVGMRMSTGMRIYLGGLGLAGAGVMVATAMLDWGFWGWFGGGLLVLAGWGSLIGNYFKVGWQPALGPCPKCGAQLHFLTKKQHVRCVGCETLLAVAGQALQVVPADSIAAKPEFPVPYVSGVGFPPLCSLCGEPATGSETVRWDKHREKQDYMVVKVIEITKIALEVPVCARHLGQHAVELDYGDHPSTQHDGVCVRFRSLPALERFREHNAALMPAIENTPQMPHAPTLDA
ncbi:MAG: hypothetical protein KC431_08620 [Myxococcales bacterium]|nr:hypothetical protein [Myxococcales bacterium]